MVGTQQIFEELHFCYPLCSFCLQKIPPLFPSLSQWSPLIFFSPGLKALDKHFPRSLQPLSEINKKYPDSNCTITSYGLSWFSYILLLMVHLSFHSRSRHSLIVLMAHLGHLQGSSSRKYVDFKDTYWKQIQTKANGTVNTPRVGLVFHSIGPIKVS